MHLVTRFLVPILSKTSKEPILVGISDGEIMESVAYDGDMMSMESILLARVRCSITSRFSDPFINSAISIMSKSNHSIVEKRL